MSSALERLYFSDFDTVSNATISNGSNVVDQYDVAVASIGQVAAGNWTGGGLIQNTSNTPTGIAYAVASFYITSSVYVDDVIQLQFYDVDTVSWITVATYNSGSPPPEVNTEIEFTDTLQTYFEAAADKAAWVNALCFQFAVSQTKGSDGFNVYTKGVKIDINYSVSDSNPGTANLVLQCKCDDNENDSDVTDSSEYANTGTVDNGENDYSSELYDDVNEFVGVACFDLDGSDDFFYFPDDTQYDWGNVFSVAIAVNADDLVSNTGLINKGVDSTHIEFGLNTNDVDSDTGRINFRFGDPSTGAFVGNKITNRRLLTEGEYHLIVATYNVGDVHIYVDGDEASIDDGSAAPPATLYHSAGAISIGKSLAGLFTNGKVDMIMIFDDELTAGEAGYLWNSGAGRELDISGGSPWNAFAQQM